MDPLKKEENTQPKSTPQGPVVLKSLRTFQGDVAEAMKKQNTSVLSIALAEQNKPLKYAPPQPSNKPVNFERSERVIEKIPGARPLPRPVEPPMPPPESPADKIKRIEAGNYKKETPPSFTARKVKPEDLDVYQAPKVAPKASPVISKPATEEKPSASFIPSQPSTSATGVGAHGSIVFRGSEPRFDPDFKKNVLTIIASIVLILLGAGSVVGFYILQKSAPSKVIVTPAEQTLITYDQKQTIPAATLDRDDLIQALNDAKSKATLTSDQVLYLALTSSATSSASITTNDLFTTLQTSAPAPLLRSFGDTFMFGDYGDGEAEPFLLIQVNDFDNAFDGMLAWEKTMNQDVGAIFSPRAVPITAYVPTATTTLSGDSTTTVPTTSIVNPDLTEPTAFTDETYQNKDARVLKNFRGDPILLYSFLDNHTLLITSDESVLEGILNKLVAGKLVH